MASNNLPEVNGIEHRPSTDSSVGEVSERHIVLDTVEKKKIPKRVLHFSDGTLEEYSTDEDDVDNPNFVKKTTVGQLTSDPKALTWGPWFWYQTVLVGSKTLAACDFLGEKLARFFGITTPKYEYEIDFYNTMKAEEEEERKRQDMEMGGWTNTPDNSADAALQNGTISSQVTVTPVPVNERTHNWTHNARIGTAV